MLVNCVAVLQSASLCLLPAVMVQSLVKVLVIWTKSWAFLRNLCCSTEISIQVFKSQFIFCKHRFFKITSALFKDSCDPCALCSVSFISFLHWNKLNNRWFDFPGQSQIDCVEVQQSCGTIHNEALLKRCCKDTWRARLLCHFSGCQTHHQFRVSTHHSSGLTRVHCCCFVYLFCLVFLVHIRTRMYFWITDGNPFE